MRILGREVEEVEMPPCHGGESGGRSRHARHLNAERGTRSAECAFRAAAFRVSGRSLSSKAEHSADNRETMARYHQGVPARFHGHEGKQRTRKSLFRTPRSALRIFPWQASGLNEDSGLNPPAPFGASRVEFS